MYKTESLSASDTSLCHVLVRPVQKGSFPSHTRDREDRVDLHFRSPQPDINETTDAGLVLRVIVRLFKPTLQLYGYSLCLAQS